VGHFDQLEIVVDSTPSATYKGFDIYPLVYRHDPPREWHAPRPDRTYNASVVICVEGHQPGAGRSRVFPVLAEPWEKIGAARRGVVKAAEDIINGLIPGQSVVGL